MSNEKLGSWACPMGGTADVYQTKKRGRHFYTRCDCCGLSQGTAPKRQQKIFDEAKFIVDDFVTPSNVDESKSVISEQSNGEEVLAIESVTGDFDPSTDLTEPESEQESEAKPTRGVLKAALALGVVGLSVGAGVWMS